MKPLTLFFCFLVCYPLLAQNTFLRNTPEGYYEGAIIKGNSVALLTAAFEQVNDTLFVDSNVKEWVYYPPKRSKVDMSNNVLTFDTYYGTATMVFDTVYTEMVGSIKTASPALEVHLKKVPRPAHPALDIQEFTVEADGANLKASIILPAGYARPLPCAIFVAGRGCRSRQSSLEKAKVLARYGMATVVFDKRGAKGTGFDCDQTTIDLHTNDLLQVIDQVAGFEEIDPKKIGLIGGSYGGWVAPRAAARSQHEMAFLISVVGAATSIQQQQLDNAVYYTKEKLGGDKIIIRQIQHYTLLEYDETNDEITFQKMMELLEEAEKNNWKGILSANDIPSSPQDLKGLWVRRNRYDPAEDLKSFKGPFLSLLGGQDRVVPWKENAATFESLFAEAGKTNYRIVVIPAAPHYLEHSNMVRDLGRIPKLRSHHYYFKFDRVVPGRMDEIVVFLREYDLLP